MIFIIKILIRLLNPENDDLLIALLNQKIIDIKKNNVPIPIITEHDIKCAKVGMIRVIANQLVIHNKKYRSKRWTQSHNYSMAKHKAEELLNNSELNEMIKTKVVINKINRKLLKLKH